MDKRTLIVVLLVVMVALLAATAASAATLGSRSLSLGARGSDVEELQTLLEKNGFRPGPKDGIFGTMTHAAVLSYQQATGLPTVGVVGPLTSAKLLSSMAHTVQRGESLYIIAKHYNTTVDSLRRTNNLKTDMLLVAQRLVIPGGQTSTTTTTRAMLSTNERELLARIVHSEAMGEPFSGMVAVAAVVFNRVASSQFPNSVSSVIYQPYQFEPVLNGWVNKVAGSDAYRAVDAALGGQDPSFGAVFFYNPVKAPHRWLGSKPVTIRIGNHVFLK